MQILHFWHGFTLSMGLPSYPTYYRSLGFPGQVKARNPVSSVLDFPAAEIYPVSNSKLRHGFYTRYGLPSYPICYLSLAFSGRVKARNLVFPFHEVVVISRPRVIPFMNSYPLDFIYLFWKENFYKIRR